MAIYSYFGSKLELLELLPQSEGGPVLVRARREDGDVRTYSRHDMRADGGAQEINDAIDAIRSGGKDNEA